MRTREELATKTMAARDQILQDRRNKARNIADEMEVAIDAQVDACSEEGQASTVIKIDAQHEELLPEIIVALRAIYKSVHMTRSGSHSIHFTWD